MIEEVKKIQLLYCKWCPHDCQGLTEEEKLGCLASGGFVDEPEICQLFSADDKDLREKIAREMYNSLGNAHLTWDTCDVREKYRYIASRILALLPKPQPVKLRRLTDDFPEIICLCGSTKFKEAFTSAQLEETLAGKIVLTIGCNMKSDTEIFGCLTKEEFNATKVKLDELHKRKIDLADEVLILNVGGYIGSSTKSEIEYAEKLGKPIKYLETKSSQIIKE